MSDQLSSDLASLRLPRDENPERGRGLRWLLGVGALALAGVGFYWFGYPLVEARLFKTAVGFTEVMLVSPAQSSTELTATGYVVPQVLSRVAAKIPGRVARVHVREGDAVTAGQVLLELEDADQRALVAAAESRVLAARARAQSSRANLAEVETQLARDQRLVATGSMGKATVEDLQARLHALDEAAKAADAEARVAQADVASAQATLKFLTVRAPISGTVIAKPPEAGEPVSPAAGFVEIADFASLEVEADVPEARLAVVKIGGPCEIALDAFPGKRYRGQVAEIGRRVNRQKASLTVKVRFLDADDGVLPDMAARVSFLSKALDAEAAKEPSKIVVPEAALVDRGGAKVVFVADPSGTVRMTPVTVGAAAQGGLVLVSGPPPGTRLVKDPPATLADGQSVKEKSE